VTRIFLYSRDETGACYAIDIGGTNFRVVYYKLSDKRGVIVSTDSSSSGMQRVWRQHKQHQCQAAALRKHVSS
jgi:hexokinase